MKLYAHAMDLKPDEELIRQYVEYHRHVPPEVIEAGKKIGIMTQKIFLVGNRLFRIIETTDDFDPYASGDYAGQSPTAKVWDDRMNTYQMPLEARKDGEWWALMKLVFECK